MEKIERDGKVAVLVSPGFGAGWSTWNSGDCREILCMDAEIVQAVLDGDIPKVCDLAKSKVDSLCALGAGQLVVEWVPKGTKFEIDEYDGAESLRIIDPNEFMIA